MEEIAHACSSHRFAETYAHLAPDVRWELIGGSPVVGRDDVIATCTASLEYLSQATTDFRKFRSVVGSDSVVVDAVAEYVGADGDRTVVASCDIYDFVDGAVATITSYTVEIGDQPPGDQE